MSNSKGWKTDEHRDSQLFTEMDTHMDTTFSFKRIGYILRADFIEYKIYAVLWSICCLVAWGFLGRVVSSVSLFYMFLVIMGVNYCSYVGRKLFQNKAYLTLPASNVEKYIVLLIEGLALLLTSNLLFWAGTWIGCVLSDSLMPTWSDMYGLSATRVSVVLFLFTVQLLFYVSFRRMPLLLYIITVILSISCLVYVCLRISLLLVDDMSNINTHVDINTDVLLAPFYYIYEYGSLIMFAASAGVLYLVYYKLKKKQLR